MLIPRKVKHRKQHHPSRSGKASGGTAVTFGEYGIQALEPAYLTNRQFESARIAINRHIRRGGTVTESEVEDLELAAVETPAPEVVAEIAADAGTADVATEQASVEPIAPASDEGAAEDGGA